MFHLSGFARVREERHQVHGKLVRPHDGIELEPPTSNHLDGEKLVLFSRWKKNLGDIETENEVEREEVFVFVAEDAEFLKCLLDPLILADQPPVDQVRYLTTKHASVVARPVTKRDGCIEGAKDDQVLPNPLEDASSPDLEKVE